jgi:KaiC/GvpD/RAD55 family RecA-like ATPase
MKKGKLDGLEVELASSILYYDDEELARFMEVFEQISAEANMVIDGVFTLFVQYIQRWSKDMEGKKWDDPEERKASMVNGVQIRIRQMPNAKERENMDLWLEKVLDTHVPMELADDILYHFVWDEFKKSIELIDKTDVSFADKLAIRPKMPQSLSSDGITYLGDIEVENEQTKNKFVTGNETLDRIVRLEAGGFVVIAARPGVGKSLFMLQMSIANAKQGNKCLYFSLEMNKKQLNERISNYHMGENLREKFTDDHGFLEFDGFKKAMDDVKAMRGYSPIAKNLQLYVTSKSDANAILADIEDQVKQNKYEMVYLDYLQLLRYGDQNEWESIRTLTNSLKKLASRLGVRVITGSQVSRSSTERGLYLTDLFGGSTIEADTDIVIGLEETRERKRGTKAAVTLKVMKNRDGDIGQIPCYIDYSIGKLYNSDNP